MKNLKFELILVYYKRPKMVLNALESISKLTYDDWHLTFIDDSGDNLFESTLFNYGIKKEKISYIPIMIKDEKKVELGGSLIGKYMNSTILNTDSDVILIICDDDALVSDYLNNLNNFYNKNPDQMWAYTHVKFFDPENEHYSQASTAPEKPELNSSNLNQYTTPIYPPCRLDSSQVSFRKEAFLKSKMWYPFPQTRDLDRSIFEKFSAFWGLCPFAGCFGQYKGWFENQLGYRWKKNNTDFQV